VSTIVEYQVKFFLFLVILVFILLSCVDSRFGVLESLYLGMKYQ